MTMENTTYEPENDEDAQADKEYRNKYLFCRPVLYHQMSNAPEVDAAVMFLLEKIGYPNTPSNKAFKTMRMLVCNLYHNYVGSTGRYLRLFLTKNGRMKLMRRYNRLEINYVPLRKCIAGLRLAEFIEYKKGYFNKGLPNGYQTRIRAEEKLITLLVEEFGLNEDMITDHPDQECILLKNESKDQTGRYKKKNGETRTYPIKVKKLVEYEDDERTKRWRNFLVRYNNLLSNTYIDVDLKRYEADPENPLTIDLADKTVRRIFSHSVFTKGGRFYGGFWQKMPESLRERIILNGQHVCEIDFSGMMVHILYAFKGKKLGELMPYIVPKSNDLDQQKQRELYKKLLVVGCNADSEKKAIEAVRSAVKSNPDKYPGCLTGMDDSPLYFALKAELKKLADYHPVIADYLGSGVGIRTQYVDSDIAYRLLSGMTKKGIPVLCIHDSFVCRESDRDTVFEALKVAYVNGINALLVREKHGLKITPKDVYTKETGIGDKLPLYLTLNRDTDFHVLNPLWSNNEQYERQRRWMRTKDATFNVTVNA